MKNLSYAQNQEDVLLNRIFPGRCSGFYIDVGASHPIVHSVTKLFYERGWHGINIEPIPSVFEILASDRARDINLPIGLSNLEGTLVFYELPAAPDFSTFSRVQAEEHRRSGFEIVEHPISVTTLARVCEQYDVPTIDFLKIDVESHEREVLEGGDWDRFRPRVVVIEATEPAKPTPSHEQWESLLLSADYLFAFFDGLNRYYVRAEDRDLVPLLGVPANFFDDFELFQHHRRVQELQQQAQGFQQQAQGFQQQAQGLKRMVEEIGDERERIRAALEYTQADLEGTREALAGARRDLHASGAALHQTRVALEEMRGRLGSTQAELDETRVALEEMRGRLGSTQAELVAARARLDLFDGWGPMTIGVVRRLRSFSTRVPVARSALKRTILLRRKLLAAMAR